MQIYFTMTWKTPRFPKIKMCLRDQFSTIKASISKISMSQDKWGWLSGFIISLLSNLVCLNLGHLKDLVIGEEAVSPPRAWVWIEHRLSQKVDTIWQLLCEMSWSQSSGQMSISQNALIGSLSRRAKNRKGLQSEPSSHSLEE